MCSEIQSWGEIHENKRYLCINIDLPVVELEIGPSRWGICQPPIRNQSVSRHKFGSEGDNNQKR
jgi:hypothetical protein